MSAALRFADVVVNHGLPLRQAFTYRVPERLGVELGSLVAVPFGQRLCQGVVAALSDQPAYAGPLRDAEVALFELPLLRPHQVALARWIADRYRAPLWDAFSLFLPPGVARGGEAWIEVVGEREPRGALEQDLLSALAAGPRPLETLPPRHDPRTREALVRALVAHGVLARRFVLPPPRVRPRLEHWVSLAPRADAVAGDRELRAVRFLMAAGGAAPRHVLRTEAGADGALLQRLVAAGALMEETRRIERDPLAAAAAALPPQPPPAPTAEQQAALVRLSADDWRVALLDGVTGSGKTEVYLRLAAETLAAGRDVLLLVPEIALTPQLVARVLARFPGIVAMLHSGLGEGARYDAWWRVRHGEVRVVVGPRSALFAPLRDPGLIVLDEEHDASYKEEQRPPRYHTRVVAEELARRTGARLLLGSATLSLDSRLGGRLHGWPVVRLHSRAGGGVPPRVELVDMAAERRAGVRGLISRPLEQALDRVVTRGRRAVIFLNRRGAAAFLRCARCGHVPACPRCGVAYRAFADGRLRCLLCGRSRLAPAACRQCNAVELLPVGAGTEQVVSALAERWPEEGIVRWDRDTARTYQQHAAVLERFVRPEVRFLVGTQMLAKGMDVPDVDTVGVLDADTGLALPDFRARERALQTLVQVCGRAGRAGEGGQAFVQTYRPEDPVLRALAFPSEAPAEGDAETFWERELAWRERMGYPPAVALVRLVSAVPGEERARRQGETLRRELEASRRRLGLRGIRLAGPVPCLYPRVRGLARWQLLCFGDCGPLLDELALPDGWAVDVDPERLW